jgi:hypothetical protein
MVTAIMESWLQGPSRIDEPIDLDALRAFAEDD